MKKSEKVAKEALKNFDIHTTRKGGANTEDNPQSSKSTSLRNLKDAVNTFRKGR